MKSALVLLLLAGNLGAQSDTAKKAIAAVSKAGIYRIATVEVSTGEENPFNLWAVQEGIGSSQKIFFLREQDDAFTQMGPVIDGDEIQSISPVDNSSVPGFLLRPTWVGTGSYIAYVGGTLKVVWTGGDAELINFDEARGTALLDSVWPDDADALPNHTDVLVWDCTRFFKLKSVAYRARMTDGVRTSVTDFYRSHTCNKK